MMLNVRPRFEGPEAPWPGVIMNAFDVTTLAALGRLKGLSAGAVLPNTESHPEILAQAQAELASRGIEATCHEEVQGGAPWAPTYYRYCETEGGTQIGADLFRADLPDVYKDYVTQVAASDMFYQEAYPDPDPFNLPIMRGETVDFAKDAQMRDAYYKSIGYQVSPVQTGNQTGTNTGSGSGVTHQTMVEQRGTNQVVTGGDGSAADRQPGTIVTQDQGHGQETVQSMFGGMDTKTLLIGAAAVLALVMATRK